jgi:hypothetical protein
MDTDGHGFFFIRQSPFYLLQPGLQVADDQRQQTQGGDEDPKAGQYQAPDDERPNITFCRVRG